MTAVADAAAGVVRAVVEVAAPPEKVWRALTDPKELEAWWGSAEMYQTFDWKSDLRPRRSRRGESSFGRCSSRYSPLVDLGERWRELTRPAEPPPRRLALRPSGLYPTGPSPRVAADLPRASARNA